MAKREISAGGAVFRKKNSQILWLVSQPKREKKEPHWRLPKGVIEKGESSKEAAVREVEEETGVRANVLEKLGESTHFYTFKGEKIFKVIVFYLMEFLEETGGIDKVEIEAIEWLGYDEAHERLTFNSEKDILEKGKKLLEERENQEKLF